MVRVSADNATHMWENIFSMEKLAAVISGIHTIHPLWGIAKRIS